jgi:hypothetical protein
MGDALDRPIQLGELIDRLKETLSVEPPPYVTKGAPSRCVYFDWANAQPDGIHSDRGDYAHLAVGIKIGGPPPTVAEMIAMCEEADGQEYSGWKGGEFRMTRTTPVHIGNYGDWTQFSIVGVELDEPTVYLITRRDP